VLLVDPYGITVDSARNDAFVTLRAHKQVLKLTLTVDFPSRVVSGHASYLAQLNKKPAGVAVLSTEHLLLCCGASLLRVHRDSGLVERFAEDIGPKLRGVAVCTAPAPRQIEIVVTSEAGGLYSVHEEAAIGEGELSTVL
jgi:hypothetical protein